MHNGQKPFACALCPAMFSALAKLKAHIKGHSSDTQEQKPYKCAECHRKFSQPRNLHRHMVLSHGDTSGPFTVTLMSPERMPFNDCNGQKRPLPEDARKSAFTPVSKAPCLSPSYTLPSSAPLTPPAFYQPQRTGLSITNVKSLHQEQSPSFPDIKPLYSDDSRSPPSKMSMKFVKKEQISPRHHPYHKKIAPKPMPQMTHRPVQQFNNAPVVNSYVNVQANPTQPSPTSINIASVSGSPPRPIVRTPTSVKIAQPVPVQPKNYGPVKSEPLPTQNLQFTVVHQLQVAAIATSFDMMVRARQAYQTFQMMKCFYKSVDGAKKMVNQSQMDW